MYVRGRRHIYMSIGYTPSHSSITGGEAEAERQSSCSARTGREIPKVASVPEFNSSINQTAGRPSPALGPATIRSLFFFWVPFTVALQRACAH